MARNLYDIGDRSPNQKMEWLGEKHERSAQVMPLGIVLVALAIGALVIIIMRNVLPSPVSSPTVAQPTSINVRFSLCDDASGQACVLGPGTYAYQGRSYHLSDISVPSLNGAQCPAEAERAQAGRMALLSMLNGGAFDARPDEADADPLARMLVRDGVSLGELMILKNYARPWSGTPINWCAQEADKSA